MNLNILFSVIPNRIEYLNSEKYTGNKPCIKVFDDKQNIEIVLNDLFNKQEYILHDLRILAFIWNDLIIDQGQSNILEKQIEIAEFLGGKGNRDDVLTMIYWIHKECDIDNYKIIQLIDTQEEYY